MDIKDNKGIELSLTELLAVIVRGGWKIIIFSLIFALLLGGVSMLKDGPVVSQQDFTAQEKALEKAEKIAAKQWDYLEKAPAMQIDPFNEVSTVIIFAVSGVEYDEILPAGQDETDPVSYMVSRIQSQYLAIWSSMDLEQIVEGTVYEGIADSYLREVVKLASKEGYVMQLKVIGNDADECKQLAQKLYGALVESREKVIKASCHHELVQLNDMVTKVDRNFTLEEHQTYNYEKMQTYLADVSQCEIALAEARTPVLSSAEVVKNVIVGAIVGFLLTAVWLVAAHYMKNRISSARQMENRYGMPHLGSLIEKKGVFTMLGYRVTSEKLWNDEKQALAYLYENGVNYLPENGQVAVVSTLEEIDSTVKADLMKALSTDGRKVVFVTDLAYNPEALAAIMQSSGIVLAERAFATQNGAVRDLLKMAKRLDKPVCGFVLV